MKPDALNSEYWQRRAAQERAAAQGAADERAARSHRELAWRFDQLAGMGETAPKTEEIRREAGILAGEFRIIP